MSFAFLRNFKVIVTYIKLFLRNFANPRNLQIYLIIGLFLRINDYLCAIL